MKKLFFYILIISFSIQSCEESTSDIEKKKFRLTEVIRNSFLNDDTLTFTYDSLNNIQTQVTNRDVVISPVQITDYFYKNHLLDSICKWDENSKKINYYANFKYYNDTMEIYIVNSNSSSNSRTVYIKDEGHIVEVIKFEGFCPSRVVSCEYQVLSWRNDNLISKERYYKSSSGEYYNSRTSYYEYDEYLNPYFNMNYLISYGHYTSSRNNVIRCTTITFEGDTLIDLVDYQYNSEDLPIESKYHMDIGNMIETFTEKYIYEEL